VEMNALNLYTKSRIIRNTEVFITSQLVPFRQPERGVA
jgi:hypothetical protein